jgi:hypothetical protein
MQVTTPKTTRNPARSSAGRVAFASLLLLGLDTATKAVESANLGVSVGVGASDNIGLVSTDPRSEVIALTGLDFTLLRTNTRLDADVVGDFTYLDYLRHTYGSQLLGRFDGTGVFAIVPETLTWTLQDDYGQAQLDAFSPVTPANLQNVNYLSTGPDLVLHMDPVDFVALSARYERATYSVSPFNNNGLVGAMGLGRQLAAHVKASLNVRYEKLKFEDNGVGSGINLASVYGLYEAQLQRTNLTAQLGATRVTGQAGLSTGALAHLDASRKISPHMNLTLSLAHQLTDAADAFSGFRAGAVGTIGTAISPQVTGGTAAPTAQTAGAYTTNSAGVGWSLEYHRTTLSVTGRYQRDSYDLQSLDDTRAGAELNLQRQFTRHLMGTLHGSYYRTRYLYTDFLSNDRLVGGLLQWRVGRDFTLVARYDHTQRSAAGIGTGGFHENRVFLTVGYHPPAWQKK